MKTALTRAWNGLSVASLGNILQFARLLEKTAWQFEASDYVGLNFSEEKNNFFPNIRIRVSACRRVTSNVTA